MKILVSTSLLSPYRVDWLNELGKYAQVDILYLNEGNAERNQEWLSKRGENCSYTLLQGKTYPKIGKLSNGFINTCKKHGKEYDVIIMDGYGYTDQMRNLAYLNRKGMPYYVNIDGAVPQESENKIVALLKKSIISKVPYFLCGSRATGQILKKYGSKDERIIYHPFTSLYEKDLADSVATLEEKIQLREKLQIKEKHVVISVGRFSYLNGYGKGYDALIRAAQQLPEDIGWYIIGGEPTEEFANMVKETGLQNIHFVDFMDKEALKAYYRAADIFALMTVGDVWGLVINEAMACGLPVITTDKCVAGVELVKEGENGYIVKVGDDKALADRVREILQEPCKTEVMGKNSLEAIQAYTIENMAKVHMEIFKKQIGE